MNLLQWRKTIEGSNDETIYEDMTLNLMSLKEQVENIMRNDEWSEKYLKFESEE